MTDLKPCPFCGGGAEIDFFHNNDAERYAEDGCGFVRVGCWVCWACCEGSYCRSPENDADKIASREEAIKAWNRRVPAPRDDDSVTPEGMALVRERAEGAIAGRTFSPYAQGFAAGQAALKDVGKLAIIDSPELVQLRDALTQSRAEAAAAYERAGDCLIECSVWCDSQGRADDGWRNGVADAGKHHRTALRALATPDQSAALAAIVSAAEARGRETGMREAGRICEEIEETLRQGYAATAANAVGEAYVAILAAIPKGE